jgi:hypothetical protein
MVSITQQTTTIGQGASFGIRTHMVLSGGGRPCTDLLDDVESFAASTMLTVTPSSGSPMSVPYNTFGVFEDNRTHGGPVTITGTVPPGFAVSLRLPGFTALSTDRDQARVIWQREPDGRFFVFFRDGLSTSAPITVTPECGS